MSRTLKSVGLVIVFICCFLASGPFVTSCLRVIYRQPLVVISEIDQSPAKIFAGETFTESFNLTNVGNRKASMVQLSLDISYPFLIMGSSSNIFVGDLEPEESRSISVEILVDKDANGLYHIEFSIMYKDNGRSYTESGTFGVQIFGRPEIDIREVVGGQSSSEIFAGETFTKIFNLTNAGNDEVKMVQLSVEASYPFSVVGSSSNLLVGDLDPGESRLVSVEILVDENAIGVYYIEFTIGYKDGDGETYTQSGAFVVEVFGRPEIDIREVVGGQSSLKVFTGDTFTECFNLTNLGAMEAKMVHLSLNITHPFAMAEKSSDLFVGDLGAGESRSISVEISVDKNALVGVYSMPFGIQYEDSNGESYTQSGEFGVEVFGRPQIYIDEIRVEPSSLTPGQDGLMTVGLTNVGTDVARDASTKIFGGKDIIASSFAHTAKIDSKKSESIIFPISIDSKLEPGTYLLKIIVSYRDDFNSAYQLSKLYEFKVLAPTPFVPYSYLTIAAGFIALALFGYFIYAWEPREVGREKQTKNPSHTRRNVLLMFGKALLISCILVAYVLLLEPHVVHTNLENVGVVVYSKEIMLESLPDGVQEVCRLRGLVTPVVLLVKHLNPDWVTMVVTSEKFSLDTFVEVSDYVVNWRVDWRDFNFADQSFDRFAIAEVRRLGSFETGIETMISTEEGRILYELSRIDFYAGPILAVLCLAVLLQGRLALWNLPALLGCYSFQVFWVNALALEHHLYVAGEWKAFGYLFIVLLPLALYLWHFERGPGGRAIAWKMRALSQALGLSKE